MSTIFVGFTTTVTVHFAVLPSEVFALMIAVPADLAVITPSFTVQTVLFEELHVTSVLIPSENLTASEAVFPLATVSEVLLRVIFPAVAADDAKSFSVKDAADADITDAEQIRTADSAAPRIRCDSFEVFLVFNCITSCQIIV